MLQRQVDRLESYPEMSERIRQHIVESQEQARRLEELLAQFNTSHSSFKDTVASIMGNVAALAHSATSDEVIKNTFANYAFEHFEIAADKSLLSLTDTVGQSAAKSVLNQSLREEVAMAEWIDQHIGPTTLRFVQLSAAGVKAKV